MAPGPTTRALAALPKAHLHMQPEQVRRLLRETAEDERAEGSGWLEIQVDPSGYAAHLGGLTPVVELVLDAARQAAAATGVGIGVIIASNRTKHPLEARTLARLAAPSPAFIETASFCVALLWAIHPIHNAAVAYVAGRADSLAMMFALAGWLLFTMQTSGWRSRSFRAGAATNRSAAICRP